MNNVAKKILSGLGFGGMAIGGLVMNILYIIVVWGTALWVISMGISIIVDGNWLWGLVVLFIGTPVITGIAEMFFPLWLLLMVGLLLVWLIMAIF